MVGEAEVILAYGAGALLGLSVSLVIGFCAYQVTRKMVRRVEMVDALTTVPPVPHVAPPPQSESTVPQPSRLRHESPVDVSRWRPMTQEQHRRINRRAAHLMFRGRISPEKYYEITHMCDLPCNNCSGRHSVHVRKGSIEGSFVGPFGSTRSGECGDCHRIYTVLEQKTGLCPHCFVDRVGRG